MAFADVGFDSILQDIDGYTGHAVFAHEFAEFGLELLHTFRGCYL